MVKKFTYLALGYSYTIGEEVEATHNFPNQLVRLLNEDGISVASPKIIAKTGWTTDELKGAIEKSELHPPYDIVTLLIGVNNQYRGRTVENYVPEFESLLKQAIEFAGNDTSHVIVYSIPDWGVTPFAKGRNRQQIAFEIDAYNEANEKLSGKYGVHYINITPGTRKASADHSYLAPDGLHPSGYEYSRWAKAGYELLVNILKKESRK